MLHRITLHLARKPAVPQGSARHNHEIAAPLDAAARLRTRDRRRVRWFRAGEPDRHGRLVHRAGGADGATWLVDHDDSTTEDDETGCRLETHRFVVGEYASLRDPDGDLRSLRVARTSKLERAVDARTTA